MINYYHDHVIFQNLYHHEGKCIQNISNKPKSDHDQNFFKIFSIAQEYY